MKLGILVPDCGGRANPAVLRAATTAAEQVGYASVWVTDRLPAVDPVAAVAAAAAVSTRVRLGVSAFVAPWYDPALLARSLVSLDALSEDRLTVALALGRGPGPAPGANGGGPTRAARLESLLDALDAQWPEGRDGDGAGRRARPPLLLATTGAAGLDRVARRADGWHPAGLAPAEMGRLWAGVLAQAGRYGRSPDDLRLVVRADLTLTPEPLGGERPPYAGSVEQVAADVVAAAAAGADEVVLAACPGSGFDQALDAYARVAEVVGAATGARRPGF